MTQYKGPRTLSGTGRAGKGTREDTVILRLDLLRRTSRFSEYSGSR